VNPRFAQFPDWTVEVRETSAGVYRVTATDFVGRKIELQGFDPDELLKKCQDEIRKITAK